MISRRLGGAGSRKWENVATFAHAIKPPILTQMRGRFAPSPTGAMHLGNARTALLAWLAVRSQGGIMIMRLEDLDQARVPAQAEAQLLDDLRWLGLDWDEGPDVGGPFAPYRQTERRARYDAAIDRLLASGQAFLCACSRADVLRAASAPHESLLQDEGEERRYPGTCRTQGSAAVMNRAQAAGRLPAVRFRGGQPGAFVDDLAGPCDPFGADGVDDFVLRRADGLAAYQLAVVVDDAAMKIDCVVRGADLLRSTPRQRALFAAFDLKAPAYAHVPLVLAPGGERLAKRTRPPSIADLRAAKIPATRIIGVLAHSAGLVPAAVDMSPQELKEGFALSAVATDPAELHSDIWG